MVGKLAAVAILSLPAATIYADSQAYKIQFDRPAWVGDRVRIERTAVESMHYVWREGDRIFRDDQQLMGAKIIADANVLAVDGDLAKTMSFTIQALFCYDGKTDKELLPAGTVLIAEAGDPTVRFTVDDKPVSAELLRALGLLVHPHTRSQAVFYDNLFGTTVSRHVGDTWNLDSKTSADYLRRMMPNGEIAPDDVLGKATLVDVEPVNNVPCTKIEIDLHANGLRFKSPTSQPSQPGYSDGDISVHLVQRVPIELTSQGGDGTYSSVRHYAGQIHIGKRVQDFEETVRDESETKTMP